MNEKPEAWTAIDSFVWPHIAANLIRKQHAENERLKAVALQAQNAAIDLAKENERLQNLLYDQMGKVFALRAAEQMRKQIAELKHAENERLKAERDEAVKAEREACCEIVYGLCESDNVAQRTVEAIRARGEENKS